MQEDKSEIQQQHGRDPDDGDNGLRHRKRLPDTESTVPERKIEEKDSPSKDSPSSSQSSVNVFTFWAVFVGIVSIITALFMLVVSLTSPSDSKAEFLRMPPDLFSHYSKGKLVKAQIGSSDERQTIQIFVTEEGPRDAETVLLLHGFGASSFSFRNVLTELASKGIHAVALDFPGFGLSDKTSFRRDERRGGFIGRIRDVYLEIKEKGIFWGFEHILETGTMPYVETQGFRDSMSRQPLDCSAQELSQSLEQVIEMLGIGPVHLVLHDFAFESGAVWALSNPSSVRSVSIVDAIPWDSAIPVWFLKFPALLQISTLLPLSLQSLLLRKCCFRATNEQVTESHGILFASKEGRKAALEIGKRANRSFDVEAWGSSESMREVPMQILWAVNWSRTWQDEGQKLAELFARASFVGHSGGRWPQEDAASELSEIIAKFILSLPPTVRKMEDEVPEHIQKMFDELDHDHHSHAAAHTHTHTHAHYEGGGKYAHFGAYMDGHAHGHGGWY